MKHMSLNVATLNKINVGRGKIVVPIVEPLGSSVFDVTGRKNVALLPDLHLNPGRCKFTTFRMHTDMAKGTLLSEEANAGTLLVIVGRCCFQADSAERRC